MGVTTILRFQALQFDPNGIDITTDEGAAVFSIFDGAVSSVFSLPGAGTTIIITHGGYKTVYSNLSEVTVEERKRQRGTKIGAVIKQSQGAEIHFEVWKV